MRTTIRSSDDNGYIAEQDATVAVGEIQRAAEHFGPDDERATRS
jgi:hypothetical protein